MMKIHVITEGATERLVGKVLYDRDVLSKQASPQPQRWRSPWDTSRDGYDQVVHQMREKRILETLKNLPHQERLLLIFDQEDAESPRARADVVTQDLELDFQSIEDYSNLFMYTSSELKVVLHISDAKVEGIERRDFDGYILQLLQSSYKDKIAQRLVPAGNSPTKLLEKAECEITRLMRDNGYPWTHAKSWLYAYITAFQFRQSHVWFARDVLKVALSDELRNELENDVKQVFTSLIAAWDLLRQGDNQ